MQTTYDPKSGDITIVVKANTPKLSKSGNTMLVASETQKEAVDVHGKKVTVALNVYFKP